MATPASSSRKPGTRSRRKAPAAAGPQAPSSIAPTITFTLSVDDANLVLEGLQELPHKRVHHVIQMVMLQAAEQVQAANGGPSAPPADSAESAAASA